MAGRWSRQKSRYKLKILQMFLKVTFLEQQKQRLIEQVTGLGERN